MEPGTGIANRAVDPDRLACPCGDLESTLSLKTDAYEKLGAFYLGRPYDPKTGETEDVPLLYDSKDLQTHGVCVGMTGSGKTGLCVTLLEEAAIDGIPARDPGRSRADCRGRP